MSLKLRRNIPLILFLIGLLFFLAFSMGNQPVRAYSVTISFTSDQSPVTESLSTSQMDQIIEFSGTKTNTIFNQ